MEQVVAPGLLNPNFISYCSNRAWNFKSSVYCHQHTILQGPVVCFFRVTVEIGPMRVLWKQSSSNRRQSLSLAVRIIKYC